MDQIPSTIQVPWYSSGYAKVFVIFIILGILFWKIRPYIYHLLDTIDTIKSLFDTILSFSENTLEDVADETATGSKVIINAISPAPKKNKSTDTNSPEPEPIESTSLSKGYCYVGEWKGVRSCAQFNSGTCESGEVYSTQSQCVNPELR